MGLFINKEVIFKEKKKGFAKLEPMLELLKIAGPILILAAGKYYESKQFENQVAKVENHVRKDVSSEREVRKEKKVPRIVPEDR